MYTPSHLTTARAMLDLLDSFMLSASTKERRELWTVLTALRGPDTPECGQKRWTMVLRSGALPKYAEKMADDSRISQSPGFIQGMTGEQLADPTQLQYNDWNHSLAAAYPSTDQHAHFLGHAQRAQHALISMGRLPHYSLQARRSEADAHNAQP
jgi:hypothetical protein